MMSWFNFLQWLQAWMRWLRWSRSSEPVPGEVANIHATGCMIARSQEPVPGSCPELVDKEIYPPKPVPRRAEAATRPHLRVLLPRPEARVQAEALLSWLQKLYPPGQLLRASDVEQVFYPIFVRQKGWIARPWGSRKGVGKYFGGLPGVEEDSPYLTEEVGKRRVRCYRLPLARVASDLVDLSRLERAA